MPLKTLKRCSRRAYNEGECYNFQALGCDVLNKTKRQRNGSLFFLKVSERDKHTQNPNPANVH